MGDAEVMRIRVTLDADVEMMVRQQMVISGTTFRAVVNEIMRRGFSASISVPGRVMPGEAQMNQKSVN